jgi:hypothetical protein
VNPLHTTEEDSMTTTAVQTPPRPDVVDDNGNAAWHLNGADLNGEVATVGKHVRVSLLVRGDTIRTDLHTVATARSLADRLTKCLPLALGTYKVELTTYVEALRAAAAWVEEPSRT